MCLFNVAEAIHRGFTVPLGLVVLSMTHESKAIGETVNGFPSYSERVFHQVANTARADPQTALADC